MILTAPHFMPTSRTRPRTARARDYARACGDLILFIGFLPVFVLGWVAVLIADARQRRINREEGEGDE